VSRKTSDRFKKTNHALESTRVACFQSFEILSEITR
jgi:hypothetical protein